MRVFFFDVDGTLFDNKNSVLPKSTKYSLEKLHENGDCLILCTGRASYLLDILGEVNHLFDYKIVLNGQHIYDKNGISLYEAPLNRNRVSSLIDFLRSCNILFGLQGKDKEAISRLDDSAIEFLNSFNLRIPPVDDEFHINNDVFQLWIYAMLDDVSILREKFFDFNFMNWGSNGYDVLPTNSSKKQAIAFISNYLGVKKEDTFGFGDGDNDSYMLEAVGTGIAMGNASTLTKQKADYITDTVDNDGIYKALKHFNLID